MRRESRTRAVGLGAVALATAVAGIGAGAAAAAPKAPATTVPLQLLSFNDYHGHLQPPAGSDGNLLTAAGTTIQAGGVEYLTTHLKQLRDGHPNTLTVAAGRPHRRVAVPLRALQGRAERRDAQHPRPGRLERRQSRVRRGRPRAAADEVRRLPPHRGLLRRGRLRRHEVPVPGRQRHLQGRGHAAHAGGRAPLRQLVHGADRPHRAAAHHDQDREGHQGRLHRDDPGGHAGAGRAGRYPRRRLPRRGGDREHGRELPRQARREGDRGAPPRGRPTAHGRPVRLQLHRRRGRPVGADRPDRAGPVPEDRHGRHRPHAPAVHVRDRRPRRQAAVGHERLVVRPRDHRHRAEAQHQDKGRGARVGHQREPRRDAGRHARRDADGDDRQVGRPVRADRQQAGRERSPRRSPAAPPATRRARSAT